MKKGERIFSYICLGISVLFIIGSFFIVPIKELSVSSPGGYPIFASVLCLIFSLLVIFGQRKKTEDDDDGTKLFDPVIIAFIIMLIFYVLAIRYLHYTIATLLFLFAAVFYLKRDSWKRAVLVSYITTFLILLVFKYIFSVSLP